MSVLEEIEVATLIIPGPITTATIEVPGERGSKGEPGANGAPGVAGPATVVEIGTVSTGSPDSFAAATITGTAPNLLLHLTIPQGMTGASGAPGAASVVPGPTGPAGAKGDKGDQGIQGAKGDTGNAGPAGQGVLVLGPSDAIPANTPANTVIFRKTA